MKHVSSFRTHIGLVRDENQDSFLTLPQAGFFGVFDGMGGHKGGQVASQHIASFFQRHFEGMAERSSSEVTKAEPGDLQNSIESLNKEVHQMGRLDSSLAGLGSTLVALHLNSAANKATLYNVGDSRCYLFRKGQLFSLTIDQTWANERVKMGHSPSLKDREKRSSSLAKCIGCDAPQVCDTLSLDVEPGDTFLLCSDGLYGPVGHSEILQCLLTAFNTSESTQEQLDQLSETLLTRTLNAGAPDNTTLILVKVNGNSPQNSPLSNQSFVVGTPQGKLQGPFHPQNLSFPQNVSELAYVSDALGNVFFIKDTLLCSYFSEHGGVLSDFLKSRSNLSALSEQNQIQQLLGESAAPSRSESPASSGKTGKWIKWMTAAALLGIGAYWGLTQNGSVSTHQMPSQKSSQWKPDLVNIETKAWTMLEENDSKGFEKLQRESNVKGSNALFSVLQAYLASQSGQDSEKVFSLVSKSTLQDLGPKTGSIYLNIKSVQKILGLLKASMDSTHDAKSTYEVALEQLVMAVQLFPEFIPAKINLIRMALVGLNSGLDISDAKELLEREMELEVSHPQLMSTLVEWDIQTNGFERSSRLLDQLVVKFPNYIETYRLSAMVLAHGKQLPISVSKFFALVKTETTSQQIQAILTKMFLTDLLYVSRFKQEAHLFPFSFGREEGLDEMLQKHQEGLNATQTQLIQCFYRYSIGVTSHSKCPAVPQVLEDSRQLAKSKGLDTQAVETLQMLRQAVNRGQKDQIQKLLAQLKAGDKEAWFSSYAAYAHAKLSELESQKPESFMKKLQEGAAADPYFWPIQRALANRSTQNVSL